MWGRAKLRASSNPRASRGSGWRPSGCSAGSRASTPRSTAPSSARASPRVCRPARPHGLLSLPDDASLELVPDGLPLACASPAVLGVLDKPGLAKWAVRLSLGRVRRELGSPDARPGERAWVDQTLARAEGEADAIKDAAADFGTRAHAAFDTLVRGSTPVVDADLRRVVDGFQRWRDQSGLDLNPVGDSVVLSRAFRFAGAMDCLGRVRAGGIHDQTSDADAAAGADAVVIDFKTSKSVHDAYALQLAAYAHAYQEMADAWADWEVQKTRSGSASTPTSVVNPGAPSPPSPSATRLWWEPDASTARFLAPRPRAVRGMVVRFDRATGAAEVMEVKDMRAAWNGFKAALYLWRLLNPDWHRWGEPHSTSGGGAGATALRDGAGQVLLSTVSTVAAPAPLSVAPLDAEPDGDLDSLLGLSPGPWSSAALASGGLLAGRPGTKTG